MGVISLLHTTLDARRMFFSLGIGFSVRKVGDLIFTNGVLDERSMYHRIMSKRNIHCGIMLVKKALSPYQKSLRVANNVALCTDKTSEV